MTCADSTMVRRLPECQRQNLWSYIKRAPGGSAELSALMHLAWSSMAALTIAPLQDLLNLGAELG